MARRLKIAVASHVPVKKEGDALFTRGGFGRAVDALANHFGGVYLITCRGDLIDTDRAYKMRSSNVVLKTIPSFWRYSGCSRWLIEGAASFAAMVRVFQLWHRIDAVHARLPSAPGETAALVSKIGRKPMWILVAGDREELLGLRAWPRPIFARPYRTWLQILTRGQLCFGVGPQVAAKLKAAGAHVEMIVNTTLEKSWIVEEEEAVERARKPVTRALFVGGIGREKGCDVFLKALAKLRKKSIRLQTDFVGESNDGGSWLRGVAEDLGVADDIRYEGPMNWETLMGHYEDHQVFALPSFSEGTPKVLLEAMARGTPVIATNVGGIPAVVKDGDTGLLVPPGSHSALATALERVIEDQHLRGRLVRRGLRVAHVHTESKLATQIATRVYESMGLHPPVVPDGPPASNERRQQSQDAIWRRA